MFDVISNKVYPRERTYTVAAAPSRGPFEVPFRFHDPDTVAVYVDGERSIAYALIETQTGTDTIWSVYLNDPVQNAEIRIVSDTGRTRSLDPVFEQHELSREIDRIFALFQETWNALTGAVATVDGTNIGLVNEVFEKYDRLATALADLLDEIRAKEAVWLEDLDYINEIFRKHDLAIAETLAASENLKAEVLANALEAREFTLARAEALDILTRALDARLTTWIDEVTPERANIIEEVNQLADVLTGGLDRLLTLERNVAAAGIFVDEATGLVVIDGIAQLETRFTDAEIRLDAVESQINLTVTFADVDQRIADAITDPTQIPLLDDLQVRLSDVEVNLVAQLGMIDLKAETAVVQGVEARLTTAEVQIDSLQEAILLKVDSTDFDAVSTRLSTAEILLDTIDAPRISRAVIDQKMLYDELDDTSMSQLVDLWGSYAGRKSLSDGIAFSIDEIQSQIADGFLAEATSREVLGVRLGEAEAEIGTERLARIDADNALSAETVSLRALIEDPVTGTAANATAIDALSTRVTTTEDGIEVQAQQTLLLEARLDNPATGLAALSTAQASLETRVVATEAGISQNSIDIVQLSSELGTLSGESTATATALNSLTTRVTATESGISSISTDLTSLEATLNTYDQTTSSALQSLDARVTSNDGEISAIASDITVLEAQMGTANANITNLSAVKIDAAGAIATINQQVAASFGTLSGMAQQVLTTLADVNGVKSTYALRLDNNNVFTIVSQADPNGVRAPITAKFDVDYLRITGDLIVDGAINADRISLNAVSRRASNTRTDRITGTIRNDWLLIQEASIFMEKSGTLIVNWNAKQDYSFTRDHEVRIVLNGTVVQTRGGTVVSDYPALLWSGAVSSGQKNVRIEWWAETNQIVMDNRTLTLVGLQR